MPVGESGGLESSVFGPLDASAKVGRCPFVGRMFWLGWRFVLELVEGRLDVARHSEVNSSVGIISCEVYAEVE